MDKKLLKNNPLGVLKNIPDLIPTYSGEQENWVIKVFDRTEKSCGNYISASRREFYEVLLITGGGHGIYTIGVNSYQISGPVIIFIHPNDIISWRNLSDQVGGYYCLFKKELVRDHASLKATIDRYNIFTDKDKNVIKLHADKACQLSGYFVRMIQEQSSDKMLNVEVMHTYLQLIILESIRNADLSVPFTPSKEYKHLDEFLRLLEEEMARVNFEMPLRMKTVKEFAAIMGIHPNYLNRLLKEGTGQSVSAAVKKRILTEAKNLLLHTDWTLSQIGYSLGFEEQTNFNAFFKKHAGVTPGSFQKNIGLNSVIID